jgi:hypothetical protein
MADNGLQDIPASEFVVVKDKLTGQVLPDPIPKAWIGTDLAPNVEAASKSEAKATTEAPRSPTADADATAPTVVTSSAPADVPPADPPADTKPRTSRRAPGA